MYKFIRLFRYPRCSPNINYTKIISRKFLAPAYQCNEVWDSRLNHPLFQRINLDELYHELDQKYQKTKKLSFIDVDIFVNTLIDDSFHDEMLDLVYKLRLTSETSSSLPSMSYAVVRNLLKNNKVEDLHTVLEDRLNYGVFLDTHSTNILLDYFWRKKDFVSGTRIASHSMFQEDEEHPITFTLSLLHCFNCLLNKGEWSQPPTPDEPKEEVKVRVKYVRNEYDDHHFDLKNCNKIIGKTLMYLTKGKNDALNNSFSFLGATLFGTMNRAEEVLMISKKNDILLIKEILELIPEDNGIKHKIQNIKLDSMDVNSILESEVTKANQRCSETDIAEQCKLFKEWEEKRLVCLHEKEEMLRKIERMQKVKTLEEEMKEKETRLWFFENEEKIELEIQEREELKEKSLKDVFVTERKLKSVDEDYIPPTIRK